MSYTPHFVTIPVLRVIGGKSVAQRRLSHLCGVENEPAENLPLAIRKCGVKLAYTSGEIASESVMIEIILKERKENK